MTPQCENCLRPATQEVNGYDMCESCASTCQSTDDYDDEENDNE